MKSYTDIEQSKMLAEILPLESADYFHAPDAGVVVTEPYEINEGDETFIAAYKGAIPCWSLAALFSMLPKSAYLEKGASTELCRLTLPVELISSNWNLEPIDACVAVIEDLHEQKLL